jgi:LPXTG-site transpeptidase (sortase) family protein
MVYTPMMLEKLKAKRHLLFIGLGILLIGAGLIGNFVTFFTSDPPKITGAFRYVEKIQPEKTEAVVGIGVNPTEEPVIENSFEKGSIESNSYLVHPKIAKALEIPLIPDKIEIPAIGLVAPVVIADFNFTDVEGETFGQWIPPSQFAAAWHPDSALLGSNGNTVLNGHHNEFGEVFGKLINLESGDMVYVYAKGKKYTFVIANKMILLERGQPLDVKLANAKWLGKTDDVRLTLVTCWPAKSNTHRLILVARPVN